MANTEGMPDEVVEEMLALPSPSSVSAAAVAAVSSRRAGGRGVGAGSSTAAATSRAERIRRRDEAMRAQRERQQQQQRQTRAVDEGDSTRGVSSEDASHERKKMMQQAQVDAQPAFKLHASRAEMMDGWSEEGGVAPSATVVRSSRAPVIRSKSKHAPPHGEDKTTNRSKIATDNGNTAATPMVEERPSVSFAGTERDTTAAPPPFNRPKPVIKAAAIQERPVHLRSMVGNIQQQGQQDGQQLQHVSGKRPSKFLQRRMQKQQGKAGDIGAGAGVGTGSSSFSVGGTAGGFPSLDVPIGTFARKGGNKQSPRQPTVSKDIVALGSRSRTSAPVEESKQREENGNGSADTMLSGMSRTEIMEGIAEIESALSEQSIAFLKARGQKKKQAAQADSKQKEKQPKGTTSSMSATPKATAAPEIDKAKEAEILSSIRTDEDLDRVYSDFNASAGASVLESSAPEIEAPGGKIQDLESSTALLRSTSYRQTILAAKTTCELLSERVHDLKSAEDGCHDTGDYPAVLPVALRCLLDLPQPHRHEQLHSYVLQSLRHLVELFAHPSHRVSMSLSDLEQNGSSVYQLYFLDDDIPAPPAASCYESGASKLSAAQKIEDSPVEGALYATNSSAESATKDGEAFYADPLWTLLSRMRIIPCVARIIASAKGRGLETPGVPGEIVTQICSILSMLSLRSPGAACAIAQHKTMLPDLVEMTLTPGAHFEQTGKSKESFLVNPRAALPTMILLCTLARQSRTIASQSEPFASIISTLHAILGIPAETEEELAVQKYCLLLWRTLLRYGLAIPHLPTFISIATPHLSAKKETAFSLTADYLSAFSNVCECAKVITRSKTESSIRLTEEQADTLAMAGAWFSPHVQKCAAFLKEAASSTGNVDAAGTKMLAARLRFLLSYVAASAPSDIMKLAAVTEEETMGAKISDVDKSAFVSVVSRSECIEVLQAVFKSGLLKIALPKVLSWAFVSEWKGPLRVPIDFMATSIDEEASSCALLSAFVSLLSNMVNNESIFDDGFGSTDQRSEVISIADEFCCLVFSTLSTLSGNDFEVAVSPAARSGWIDAALYVLVKFLSSAKQRDSTCSVLASNAEDNAELRWLREMAFALIGRLKVGDEAMAAVLLSQDILFATPSLDVKRNQGSPLQAMLLQELVNSPRSQSQLDHSFKLHRGHGITAAGIGPFGLESLRSDAEFVAPPDRAADNGQGRGIAVEPLIPLGKLWLWQVLSSTIDPPPEASAQQRDELLNDAAAVIISSLELLSYMEKGPSSNGYTSQINPGAKLYHLSNSCLFPEEVLRHEKFEQLFCSLFQDISSMKDHQSIPKAFVAACYQHSRTTRSKSESNGQTKNDEADEEKLLALFEDKPSSSEEFTTKEVAALADFVGDMCSAYTEYGAQYESLNHCVRLLLRYGFPPKARIEIIAKLRGLLHLLTLQIEVGDFGKENMSISLELSLASGFQKESPEVLDALANALSSRDPNNSIRRLDAETGGYAYYFAIASLAQSYASCIRTNEPGAQEAAGRRLELLGDEAKAAVLRATNSIEKEGLRVVSAVLR